MIKIYFDGACEPVNPGGTASWGFIIKGEDGKNIVVKSGIVGKGVGMTNNVAEYHGLIAALKTLEEFNKDETVEIRGDSKLVICHITKEWGWLPAGYHWMPHRKAPHLKKLLDEVLNLVEKRKGGFKAIWIPREENEECDALSKAHVK